MSIIEKLYKKYENDEYITQLINHKIEKLPKNAPKLTPLQ
jgi:hypothetical protein